ncbi:hypothetical protein FGG08_004249 [Glutinoglossum americanum]|uniref:Beta-fructofuranosidase n=1 Tax=Glutinoglossum americanum TaxID=1670608 RepID=A0A9P8I5G0_9PEZI|nr:hypothetical protein FGG08_004249 [Glutinoglossum americanum]
MKYQLLSVLSALFILLYLTQTPTPKGDYNSPWRPQIHFSPRKNFMNDPNGLFIGDDGIWHMYYQYGDNPTGITPQNKHWGHASSKDLYHWNNHPIAISRSKNGGEIYSGSAVIDVDNTSGFFPYQTNGVVAIYTLHTEQEESQEIAYSIDGGYTFTKYEHNPVISVGLRGFRDPKVIWHTETRKWAMVVAHADERFIAIYTSSNLRNWTHVSSFDHPDLVDTHECPNLITIPMAGAPEPLYLLIISMSNGHPLGGSQMRYFPGHFNGTHFTPVDDYARRIVDYGLDMYAGQFFYGTPGGTKPVSIAWASNLRYAGDAPTGPVEGWRSSMTIPTVRYLANISNRGYDLVTTPYNLETMYDKVLARTDTSGSTGLPIDCVAIESGTVFLDVNITSKNQTTAAISNGTADFTFTASKTGEFISGGFIFGETVSFWVDRSNIKGYPAASDKVSIDNLSGNRTWRIRAVMDRSILEVFLNEGESTATTIFYPKGRLDRLSFETKGLGPEIGVSAVVWGLKSAWVGRRGGWRWKWKEESGYGYSIPGASNSILSQIWL